MSRAAILILALASAAPAVGQDRFGPAPVRDTSGLLPGRSLGWAGKVERTTLPIADATVYLPQPLATGALRNSSVTDNRPPPAATPAPVTQAENAPWRRLTGGGQPTAPLIPAGDNAPPAQPTTPVRAGGPLPAAQPAAPPPAASPDYRTDLSAKATPASEGEQAKFYSLHRDYGETPDKVPIPEKSQVFLAGAPLESSLDEPDDEGTGKTAAARKARLAADWGSSASNSPAAERVQIIRP